jgi:Zn-dependent protease
LTVESRWRSLKSNQRLPTYILFAAIGVALVVLAIRHHVVDEQTLIFFLVFIPAVILHELSHGVVALWFGDDTAKRAGRLTLNPLKHIDPVGSVLLPLVLALIKAPVFGWAKPVPVNVNNLRSPRNDAVLVSLAGPFTNVILATITGAVMHALLHVWPLPIVPCGAYACYAPISQWALIEQILFYFGIVNLTLATFNLLPIPPLDGSALIERLLPSSALPTYYQLRMGFMVVVLLFVFLDQNLLSSLLGHVENWYINLVF